MKFSLGSANVDLIFCGIEPFDKLVNIGTGRGQYLKQLCTHQSQCFRWRLLWSIVTSIRCAGGEQTQGEWVRECDSRKRV